MVKGYEYEEKQEKNGLRVIWLLISGLHPRQITLCTADCFMKGGVLFSRRPPADRKPRQYPHRGCCE
jgi:hypothetical protein